MDGYFTCRKILRHRTSGFTSHPKEGVLRIFIALKNSSSQPSLNPRTFGPVASTLGENIVSSFIKQISCNWFPLCVTGLIVLRIFQTVINLCSYFERYLPFSAVVCSTVKCRLQIREACNLDFSTLDMKSRIYIGQYVSLRQQIELLTALPIAWKRL
jgi:hypothetical protein